MPKILGRVTSINVRKVLWTADEAGLAYEREDWGLPLRDPNTPEFLALNPNGLVPVLVEDGFVLWESNAIMRYLAEAAPQAGLVPEDRQRRAQMEQWLVWQCTELAPSWRYAFMGIARSMPGFKDGAEIEGSIRRWSGRMAILERQFGDGRAYVTGESFCLADIALGMGMHRWFTMHFERPDFPALHHYYRRLLERPATHAYLTAEMP